MVFGLSDMTGGKSSRRVSILNTEDVPGVGRPSDLMPFETLAWPGNTIIRPLANPNEERTELLPWMDATTQRPAWSYTLPSVVRNAGTQPGRHVTFVSWLSDEERTLYSETPWQRLHGCLWGRVNDADPSRGGTINDAAVLLAGRKAEMLLKGGNNRGAAAPRAGACTLVQAALYYHDFRDKGKPPSDFAYRTVLLSESAGRSIDSLLTPTAGAGRREILPEGDFVFDPAAGNLLLGFHAAKVTLQLPMAWKHWEVFRSSEPLEGLPDNKGTARHVAHMLVPDDKVQVPSVTDICQRFVDWKHLVRIPSVREQMTLICSAFAPEQVADIFADGEFDELMPAMVKKYLATRNSRSQVSTFVPEKAKPEPRQMVTSQDMVAPEEKTDVQGMFTVYASRKANTSPGYDDGGDAGDEPQEGDHPAIASPRREQASESVAMPPAQPTNAPAVDPDKRASVMARLKAMQSAASSAGSH